MRYTVSVERQAQSGPNGDADSCSFSTTSGGLKESRAKKESQQGRRFEARVSAMFVANLSDRCFLSMAQKTSAPCCCEIKTC